MDGQVDDTPYPVEELAEAITSLGDVDYLRLEAAARVLALKCWADPGELMDEAVLRALDGRRRCPRRMRVVAFLIGAMRSVANEWLEDRAKWRRADDPTRWGTPAEVDPGTLADNRPDPEAVAVRAERLRFGAQVLKDVTEMFENDEEAWFIIQADLEGSMAPAEVCALLGIERRRYETVRKRIRRGYDTIRARYAGETP